jgi:hypothetical protein
MWRPSGPADGVEAMSQRIEDIKFMATMSFVTLFGTCLTALFG